MAEIYMALWLRSIALEEGKGKIKHEAYNKVEDARGAWQVRPVMIDEVYRLTGKRYDHLRMHEPEYGYEFVKTYFQARFKRRETFWKITRRWNGSGKQAEAYACSVERRYNDLLRERMLAAQAKTVGELKCGEG